MSKAAPEPSTARRSRTVLPAAEKVGSGKMWLKEVPPKIVLGETGELLSKNIKHWIRSRGYTSFEKFAYQCGIPKSTLSQMLTHTRDPRLSTLEKIALQLGLTVADLLTEPNPRPKDWAAL